MSSIYIYIYISCVLVKKKVYPLADLAAIHLYSLLHFSSLMCELVRLILKMKLGIIKYHQPIQPYRGKEQTRLDTIDGQVLQGHL